MKKSTLPLVFTLPIFLFLTSISQAASDTSKLSKTDQQALAIGRSLLDLNTLGAAGAPMMRAEQVVQFERQVAFLSTTECSRATWAWLEFRLRGDSQLQLTDNPAAAAIQQRLDLFPLLIRKYFAFE